MTNQTMKAMVANGYGGPEVYQLQYVPKPKPKSDEILVKVACASVTTADTMLRTGKPYFGRLFVGLTKPKKAIPGTGFSGEVEAIGSDVKDFKIGDRVFGETAFDFSSNAEYLVIKENGVVLEMPEGMEFSEAANYGDGHMTSLNFLTRVQELKKGQRILINGAAGSLGTSAIQLAKYMGAHVTAVCSESNFGLVKSLGADEAIDYRKEDYTLNLNSYDLIYDTVGKSSFGKAKKALKQNGVYMSPVMNFGLLGEMIKSSLFGKKKAKFEATGTNSAQVLRGLFSDLVEVYKAGKLKTVIDRQFPLEKLSEAHKYIEQGHKKGNVVLINS